MAARRGRSQARRSGGSSGGLPGWAWMVLGIVLALVAVLVLPRYFKADGEGPFFRPQPNPDAQPAISALDEDLPPPDTSRAADRPADNTQQPAQPDYDFYTMLPEQEVAMSDAQLAATAREEAERQRRNAAAAAQASSGQPATHPDAAELAARPAALPETVAAPVQQPTSAAAATPTTTAAATAATDSARYILQAGAFSASGDAEALKARIALLGLSARVESGNAAGKTVYRVRMGPYGTATELAEAKQKLGNGGLPAMAIKAQ